MDEIFIQLCMPFCSKKSNTTTDLNLLLFGLGSTYSLILSSTLLTPILASPCSC
ncbi:hypothetical protein CROQUDRAFT_462683 [Cronartium quercuum f. sp. fusiforme G11]|uniref:Uncharacterized protein n=1 Tax=Cronartium quercuum f. sp. fusiforme G11 TaxID=708437 RepID=A0A9P6THF3_9BASI|nr:hypothetical protein CROQUDRAFT_462683 [Cronartium quercuum f. sp. fusiforme G11]